MLLLYEQSLEQWHGVTNEVEDARPSRGMEVDERSCARAGTPLSSLVLRAGRATQRSVKFIRWLRQSLRDQATEAAAARRLQHLYATS